MYLYLLYLFNITVSEKSTVGLFLFRCFVFYDELNCFYFHLFLNILSLLISLYILSLLLHYTTMNHLELLNKKIYVFSSVLLSLLSITTRIHGNSNQLNANYSQFYPCKILNSSFQILISIFGINHSD